MYVVEKDERCYVLTYNPRILEDYRFRKKVKDGLIWFDSVTELALAFGSHDYINKHLIKRDHHHDTYYIRFRKGRFRCISSVSDRYSSIGYSFCGGNSWSDTCAVANTYNWMLERIQVQWVAYMKDGTNISTDRIKAIWREYYEQPDVYVSEHKKRRDRRNWWNRNNPNWKGCEYRKDPVPDVHNYGNGWWWNGWHITQELKANEAAKARGVKTRAKRGKNYMPDMWDRWDARREKGWKRTKKRKKQWMTAKWKLKNKHATEVVPYDKEFDEEFIKNTLVTWTAMSLGLGWV